MHSAKFPMHRDLAGFDFEVSPVDRKLVHQLANLSFIEAAHNAVLVGGPGTGKTHLVTAIGVSGITRHGMRVRFYSTVDLVNALEQEKTQGKAGRIAASLLRMDLVILDELGYLPFSQAGGALLFHLLSRLYEHTSVLDVAVRCRCATGGCRPMIWNCTLGVAVAVLLRAEVLDLHVRTFTTALRRTVNRTWTSR